MKSLVAGAGGFIGGHLVNRLIQEGHEVRAIDKKPLNDWYQVHPDADNQTLDLSLLENSKSAVLGLQWVFNLAADMGGMGFIENNKALCMLSSLINTHLLIASLEANVEKYFFASSACVYASWHQNISSDKSIALSESQAYPADPEDGYGWEKLFGERMARHFREDFGLETRIGRYHNVYGPYGTYDGGREKAPAAACRKFAQFNSGKLDDISIWGDGNQVRSFTYIDDCIEGTIRLMNSSYSEPLNIGSAESVTIQELYDLTAKVSKSKNFSYKYDLNAPLGVKGRSSDNTLCNKILGWEPKIELELGLTKTYDWVQGEINK